MPEENRVPVLLGIGGRNATASPRMWAVGMDRTSSERQGSYKKKKNVPPKGERKSVWNESEGHLSGLIFVGPFSP